MSDTNEQSYEIPNPHNYGEYTFAPWKVKVDENIIKFLNPNNGLRLAILYELNDDIWVRRKSENIKIHFNFVDTRL